MKKIILRLGKTGTALATIFTIICGLIALPPAFKSFTRKDLNGTWKITCHIKNSSLKRYIGKSSGYKMFFKQDENKIKGEGEMFWVDDKEIPYQQHIRISVDGILDDEYLKLTYTQYGAIRTTSGAMKLKINSDNEMVGTFEGTAADSRGIVNAKMIN